VWCSACDGWVSDGIGDRSSMHSGRDGMGLFIRVSVWGWCW